ncbi:MAG TPA: DNA mismatch repair protein MutS [Chloroflexota bacterium]|nr:DNA mismatch repair protein MutS [Chloroflexota bacterium]
MSENATPARQQYLEVKAEYPDALVWFRLGDFYEMFDDDARVASAALRITLTSRSFGKDCRVPMCGVPAHSAARFLARLVRQGHNVAVCEQLSPPGKGLVDRKVVRVITPGTLSEPELLRPGESNYLAAITRRAGRYAVAHAEVSTGEFRVAETDDPSELARELDSLAPHECLVDGEAALPNLALRHRAGDQGLWRQASGLDRLRRHLDAASLHLADCENRPASAAAAGAILAYLERTNRPLLNGLRRLLPYPLNDAVAVDQATRATLLGKEHSSGGGEITLLSLLDQTITPMGARQLARWLRRPTRNRELLLTRHQAIGELVEAPGLRAALRQALRGIGDLERLTGRVGQGRAAAEELRAIATILEAIPMILRALAPATAAYLTDEAAGLDPAPDVAAAIRAAVAPSGSDRSICPGYDREIDSLEGQAVEARHRLTLLEAEERERTTIRSLKVAYNSVFGYYIEVSKANLAKVPADYTRKQTLVNAERFVTAELLHWEAELAEAEARLRERDAERFAALLRGITAEAPRLQRTAEALGILDTLGSLAEVAEQRRFSRPELVDTTDLTIAGGRHPLVEAAVGPESYIANDCRLGGDGPCLAIVTGPNMGGKSTYLRQVALIVYLAQIGSFVPAAYARIGLVDRIVTRVGAHDHLARGQSTFLVEMAETAAIARLATPRSLVLLDEIGRGTTSCDGQAIAHAVAEYLHDVVEARALFATHYYELARVAESWPRACNLHVAAEEHGEDVVFLYSVTPGVADKSFALHVARLAGMPEPIIRRAEELVAAWTPLSAEPAREPYARPVSQPPIQLRVAERATPDQVAEDLLALDLAATTPIAALNALHRLQQQARDQRPAGPARADRPTG